jgi:protein-disulfide isomerase
MGVGGTPTFYIGAADDAGSTIKVLGVIRGAQPFARFKEAIDRALAAQH